MRAPGHASIAVAKPKIMGLPYTDKVTDPLHF